MWKVEKWFSLVNFANSTIRLYACWLEFWEGKDTLNCSGYHQNEHHAIFRNKKKFVSSSAGYEHSIWHEIEINSKLSQIILRLFLKQHSRNGEIFLIFISKETRKLEGKFPRKNFVHANIPACFHRDVINKASSEYSRLRDETNSRAESTENTQN